MGQRGSYRRVYRRRRKRAKIAYSAVLAVAACVTAVTLATRAAAGPRDSGLHLQQIASANSPLYLTAAPGETDRLYVVEQQGVVRVLIGRKMRSEPFLDVSSQISSGGERGLLSIAFDPGYATNRLFYVDYTDMNGDTRVVRYRSDGVRAIPASARQLLFVRQPYPNHNGGQLQFGPDGKLYVGMGDGGSAGDPQNRAQNLKVMLGKLLRADVHQKKPRWMVAAYGLRNPWRFSFDRQSGDLYLGDVGQDTWEEVDFLARARLSGLENFGWSVYEGLHPYKTSERLQGPGKLVWPVFEYNHQSGNCAITGGYVYRGQAIPSLRGRYVFGDYCSGAIWTLVVRNGKATDVRREAISVPSLSSFGQDGSGELYALSLAGAVYRIS